MLDALSTQCYYFEYCFNFKHVHVCRAPPEQVYITSLLVIVRVVLRYAVAVWV